MFNFLISQLSVKKKFITIFERQSLPYRSLESSHNRALITSCSWKLPITTLLLKYSYFTLSGWHLTASHMYNEHKHERLWTRQCKELQVSVEKDKMECLGNSLERKAHFAYSQPLNYRETNVLAPCCLGMGQVILAVTIQKEICLVLISYCADRRQEGTLLCPEMCTFTLLLFSPANCLRARRCLSISFLFRFPNLFSLFTSPEPQLDWGTIANLQKGKINNIFYTDFLILGRFMNFPSVMQKLVFFNNERRESLIFFLLPPELQRHFVLCCHLHFTLNAKDVWNEQIFVLIWYIC